jgi:hypothetical protein
MTTKLLIAALGIAALVTTPAMAASHHVRAHHIQTPRVLTQPVAPLAVQRVAPVATSDRGQLPEDLRHYDGYQSDRQMVGTHATGD